MSTTVTNTNTSTGKTQFSQDAIEYLKERPLTIRPKLACALGGWPSVILLQVEYWLQHNEGNENARHDGRVWTYNTYAEWRKKNFPWLSDKTIKRGFGFLEDIKILLIGHYN